MRNTASRVKVPGPSFHGALKKLRPLWRPHSTGEAAGLADHSASKPPALLPGFPGLEGYSEDSTTWSCGNRSVSQGLRTTYSHTQNSIAWRNYPWLFDLLTWLPYLLTLLPAFLLTLLLLWPAYLVTLPAYLITCLPYYFCDISDQSRWILLRGIIKKLPMALWPAYLVTLSAYLLTLLLLWYFLSIQVDLASRNNKEITYGSLTCLPGYLTCLPYYFCDIFDQSRWILLRGIIKKLPMALWPAYLVTLPA